MNVEILSDALKLDPDTGIWHATVAGRVSYPADHNAACFQLEDDSFWFSHRNRCIVTAVRRFPPEGFILDVGGGNGYVARGLLDAGYETVLLEPGAVGARNAKQSRQLPTVINATVDEARLRTGSVPNVGLFDVLEHIDDDRAFVERLHDIVHPGGLLYLTVPALGWLWSVSDIDAMHYRRYTSQMLTRTLANRFDVLYSTYLFQRLVPLSLLFRALPYRLGLTRPRSADSYRADHAAGRQRLAGALAQLLEHEVSAIAAGHALRIGSSLLAVARRV
jgi:2-polyprenyl-3-methyl-5-hydroxy-6-metoxy-1,4-benzoquinol methylase